MHPKIDLNPCFQANEFIVLKLEDNKTNIYVGNKFFQQCKKLILQIEPNNLDLYSNIGSIDDIINVKDSSIFKSIQIPPEIEFWGHCSNIQVWIENNYNPNLLNSNLSFPLLKRLAELGDLRAKVVFKEEILRKLESRNDKSIIFIIENQYLDFFTQEELLDIYKDNISRFESTDSILLFLSALSVYDIPVVNDYYNQLVKELILTGRDKKGILLRHIDILSKSDLIYLLNRINLMNFIDDEENIKYELLDVLLAELNSQHGYNIKISDLIKYLLISAEQDDFKNIIKNSKFPYLKFNFQDDEVRRRFWEKKLYFDFSEGHVISIEIYYDYNKKENFYENIERLKAFRKLRHLNILIFNENEHEINDKFFSLKSLEKINIYRFPISKL